MKKVILVLCFAVLLIWVCPLLVNAQEDTVLPGESVYASPEKQEEIAAAFDEQDLQYLKKREIWILTESITPVYYVDVWEYVDTGVWKLYPTKYDDGKYCADKTSEETTVYRAKTTDHRGVFAGDITFLYLNGQIEIVDLVKNNDRQNYSLVSYADHIRCGPGRSVLGTNDKEYYNFAPYVRYVILGEFGSAFYVNREYRSGSKHVIKYEHLYPLDAKVGIFGVEETGNLFYVYFEKDMEKVVDYLKKSRDTIGEISKKEFDRYTGRSGVNINIINISEYLENRTKIFFTERDKLIGYEAPSEGDETLPVESQSETVDVSEGNKNETTTATVYVVLAVVALCVLAVGAIAFVVKKR